MHHRSKLKTSLAILCLWIGMHTLQSQTVAGIKFGLSTPDVSPESFVVMNEGVTYYKVTVDQANFGIHAGIFMEMQMGHFFIQPEMVFNASTVQYRLDSLYTPGQTSATVDETYRYVDMPLMLGFKAGVFRIGAGPVGHLFISADDGFEGYPGYTPNFEKFSWGWQGGIGFDFWKLHLDFRYEKNNTSLGDHITFFGQSYDFATDNNRIIGSAGLSF
jgi:hypothetical protein